MSACKSCGKPICGCSDVAYQGVIADLARAKAVFQLREVNSINHHGSVSK